MDYSSLYKIYLILDAFLLKKDSFLYLLKRGIFCWIINYSYGKLENKRSRLQLVGIPCLLLGTLSIDQIQEEKGGAGRRNRGKVVRIGRIC